MLLLGKDRHRRSMGGHEEDARAASARLARDGHSQVGYVVPARGAEARNDGHHTLFAILETRHGDVLIVQRKNCVFTTIVE